MSLVKKTSQNIGYQVYLTDCVESAFIPYSLHKVRGFEQLLEQENHNDVKKKSDIVRKSGSGKIKIVGSRYQVRN